jgi:soluble lytic murein transglycosylase-like protein
MQTLSLRYAPARSRIRLISMVVASILCPNQSLAEISPPEASATPLLNALQPASPDIEPELRTLLMKSIAQSDSFQDRFDAEVWLVQKSGQLEKYIEDPAKRFEILRLVHREAHRVGIPPEFVLAVIEVESHFDRYAVSSAGAQGMMQIMPFWKKEIGREEDNLTDVQTNLRYGCTILKYYYDRADGNWAEALARYNGSYGYYWDYSEKVMVAWEKNWR